MKSGESANHAKNIATFGTKKNVIVKPKKPKKMENLNVINWQSEYNEVKLAFDQEFAYLVAMSLYNEKHKELIKNGEYIPMTVDFKYLQSLAKQMVKYKVKSISNTEI